MRQTSALRGVQNALDTNQIGTPSAVRAVFHVADESHEIEAAATLMLGKVLEWLDDAAESVDAVGDESHQMSLLVRTAQGRMALVSAGLCANDSPMVEVVIFGSRGVLFWDDRGHIVVETTSDASAVTNQAQDAIKLAKDSLAKHKAASSKQGAEAQASLLRTPLPTPEAQSPPYGLLLVSGDYTHQPGYTDALLASNRCKLIGMTDEADAPDERKRLNKQLADRLNIPMLPSLDEALLRKDVDIVSICAEPFRRGRIIVEAARAAKHLYLDKPLAGSIEDARAIAEAVRESNVVAHMFSQMLWEPARSAKLILDSGELGELVAIHCDACFAKGYAGTVDLTKARVESEVPERFEVADSKRELTNIGVYPMAMFLWLLRRDVKYVHGATGNFFFAEHQANNMEDFGQMLMELEGGVTASITAGRAGWRSHPSFGLHRVCLIGTKRSVTIDGHRPRVEVWADVKPWTAPPRDPGDPMGMWAAVAENSFQAKPKQSWVMPSGSDWNDDANYFLDCIEQGKQSEMSVDIAAAATEALLAAYQSAATKNAVGLPLPGS